MTTGLVGSAYAAVAFALTIYLLLYGVRGRPPVRNFGIAEYLLLWLTAAAVGLLWPLFLPSLGVVATRSALRHLDGPSGGWGIHLPATSRARS